MKKNVLAIVLAVIICLPCILVLDGGPNAPYGEPSLGLTNFAGLGWMAFLALGGFTKVTPKWMRDELQKYVR